MWHEYGYRENPYDTLPVKGDAEGLRLLVGRDQELRRLKNRIQNVNVTVSIEGPNGVGKTSLVLVSAHMLENETSNHGPGSIFLMPEPLQFPEGHNYDDFKTRLYGSICRFLVANEARLRNQLGLQVNLNPVRQWLEDPMHFGGGASLAGFGGNFTATPNTATGFNQVGFFAFIDDILSRYFNARGGIVCVLDNLELLNTSRAARLVLERMRDDVLAKPGLKWVVCGARGIVRSVASSPRLQGRISEPLEVQPLSSSHIEQLIAARRAVYGFRENALMPVDQQSFSELFRVLNFNLRDALRYSGDFSVFLYENHDISGLSQDLVRQLFADWLTGQSRQSFEALNVPPRAWRLFDDICARGGSISPSDNEEFGFNSPQAMRSQISPLENFDLIVPTIDETDQRRRTISITAKGWLVRHHRQFHAQN